MSRHTKTLRMGDGKAVAAREQAVDSPVRVGTVIDDGEADACPTAKEGAATAASTSSEQVGLARITAQTLERYLATAEADREAAEERAARTIARFSRLTTAMVGLTLVIAGANVVVLIRQSSVPQPVVLAAPPAVVPPALVVQPTAPLPPPPIPTQPARVEPAPAAPAAPAPVPARIHLLGKPLDQATARGSAPAQPHLARATIKPTQFRPLPTTRVQAITLEEPDRAERW
jgi:fused signal recognition particle receptor